MLTAFLWFVAALYAFLGVWFTAFAVGFRRGQEETREAYESERFWRHSGLDSDLWEDVELEYFGDRYTGLN